MEIDATVLTKVIKQHFIPLCTRERRFRKPFLLNELGLEHESWVKYGPASREPGSGKSSQAFSPGFNRVSRLPFNVRTVSTVFGFARLKVNR